MTGVLRRAVLLGAASLGAAAETAWAAGGPFAELERKIGGRLGVAGLDLQTGRRVAHRAGERFPMCSTFKAMLAGAVLARVDRGQERLERRLPVRAAEMLEHAPFTETRIGRYASVEELCAAVVSVSDNPAANMLLPTIGGPAGFTAFARSLGDRTTRLDRYELELNTAIPGDPRDTTSPEAMLRSIQALTLGTALSAASRERLVSWMLATSTGWRRIRAGAPGWRVADKTGTGRNGTTNDIAVLWPAKGRPTLLTTYLTGSSAEGPAREAALAEATRIALREMRGRRG